MPKRHAHITELENITPFCGANADLGSAVIVRGQVVAWFADFTEEARDWCTDNHFGEWLTWRAKPPEIVPMTEAERDEVMRNAAELATLLEANARIQLTIGQDNA